MTFGEADPNEHHRGEASSAPPHLVPKVTFERKELDSILGLYGRKVAEGEWRAPLTEAAKADLADFSEIMVEKLFGGLSDACRAVDPNHLNLGVRYASVK